MAKIKRYEEPDCAYKLCPLGKGLPLCAYRIIEEQKLAEAKLNDFPLCDKSTCPRQTQKEGR